MLPNLTLKVIMVPEYKSALLTPTSNPQNLPSITIFSIELFFRLHIFGIRILLVES